MERIRSKAAAGGPGWAVPHSRAEELGGTTGERDRSSATQGSSVGKLSLKILNENTCGGCGSSGRNSQPHRRVHWRDPQGPETDTNPPTQESAPEGPTLRRGLEAGRELSKLHCSPLDPFPTYSATTPQSVLPHTGEHLSPAPYYITGQLRLKKIKRPK